MYKDYLLKVNGTIIEYKYIGEYASTPNRISDLDSYQDANGLLHRNTVEHKRSTIMLKTPVIFLEDKIKLQALLPNRIRLEVDYWNDETNTYTRGSFYIPDVEYNILMPMNGTLIYHPITFELIEY